MRYLSPANTVAGVLGTVSPAMLFFLRTETFYDDGATFHRISFLGWPGAMSPEPMWMLDFDGAPLNWLLLLFCAIAAFPFIRLLCAACVWFRWDGDR
jgi:hypothetical protein